MTNAKTFLEKRFSEEMGLEDAVHTSLLTLKEGFEGQVSGSNIEVRRVHWQGRVAVRVTSGLTSCRTQAAAEPQVPGC